MTSEIQASSNVDGIVKAAYSQTEHLPKKHDNQNPSIHKVRDVPLSFLLHHPLSIIQYPLLNILAFIQSRIQLSPLVTQLWTDTFNPKPNNSSSWCSPPPPPTSSPSAASSAPHQTQVSSKTITSNSASPSQPPPTSKPPPTSPPSISTSGPAHSESVPSLNTFFSPGNANKLASPPKIGIPLSMAGVTGGVAGVTIHAHKTHQAISKSAHTYNGEGGENVWRGLQLKKKRGEKEEHTQ